MHQLRIATCLVALVLLVMCGGESSTDHTGSGSGGSGGFAAGGGGGAPGGSDGSPDSVGSSGGGGGGIIFPDSSIDYLVPNPYLDAGEDQWCAPEPGGGAVTSCCGGTPCNGGCLTLGTDKVCDCFAITGGCPSGLVCCLLDMGCTTPAHCDHSK